MSPEVWIALIAASPGLAALILQWVKQRKEARKVEADAAQVITDAAKSAVELQAASMTQLKAEVQDCKVRISFLERWVQMLTEQVEALGHDPVTKELVEERIAEGVAWDPSRGV